jgi:hypothetical protein
MVLYTPFYSILLFLTYSSSSNNSIMRSRKYSKGQGAMEYLTTYAWGILVVVTVGIVLYQAGVFNTQTSTTFTDWRRMQPLIPTVNYLGSEGQFEVGYTNTAGVDIILQNVTVVEALSNTTCITNNIAISVSDQAGNLAVKPGGLFKIIATGCPKKDPNEAYDMYISIKYLSALREYSTNHTEAGHIMGSVIQ